MTKIFIIISLQVNIISYAIKRNYMKNFMFLAILLTIGTFSCTALSADDTEITNDQIASNDQITSDNVQKTKITDATRQNFAAYYKTNKN